MADCKPASRNNKYKLPVFRLDFRNTRKWDNASWFRRNKKLYFRRSDLTSVITPNAIMQVAGAKKNDAAPKKVFASRFPKKDSRTNAKFAVLKTRSKGAFARGRKLIIRRLWRLSRERRRFAPPVAYFNRQAHGVREIGANVRDFGGVIIYCPPFSRPMRGGWPSPRPYTRNHHPFILPARRIARAVPRLIFLLAFGISCGRSSQERRS